MSSTSRSVASSPSITVRLSETRATTPAKNSVKKNPYEYMTVPAPASSRPAQATASADAASATIADLDIVRAPRLLLVVRTVVAFSFCSARAICSSIVSRRRPTGRPCSVLQYGRDGTGGSPPVRISRPVRRTVRRRARVARFATTHVHALTGLATRL
ncbi:hypothetical protein [Micromonospora fulviviridis]|uniref:Uncharacterized protein n=1 Tax=Micromonospora fulviviridis TaxID=47860 RepID=A0ABV2VC72_9ACTN